MVSGHPQTETFTCRSHAGPMLFSAAKGGQDFPSGPPCPLPAKQSKLPGLRELPRLAPLPASPGSPGSVCEAPQPREGGVSPGVPGGRAEAGDAACHRIPPSLTD